MRWMEPDTYCSSSEDGIVWLHDPAAFPYVRVRAWWAPFRRRPPSKRTREAHGFVVGYSVLAPTATGDPDVFKRRIFHLYERDRGHPEWTREYYVTSHPYEAVDPLTLSPGHPGQTTERAWNGPALGPPVAKGLHPAHIDDWRKRPGVDLGDIAWFDEQVKTALARLDDEATQ